MLYCARPRRAFNRGVKRKHEAVLKRLRKAKKNCQPMEKPECIKTHCRNMVIEPEMTGSVVGVYNGKTFTTVEIKPEMIGHYLGEFAMTYRPVKHGRPGIGATHSSRGNSKSKTLEALASKPRSKYNLKSDDQIDSSKFVETLQEVICKAAMRKNDKSTTKKLIRKKNSAEIKKKKSTS